MSAIRPFQTFLPPQRSIGTTCQSSSPLDLQSVRSRPDRRRRWLLPILASRVQRLACPCRPAGSMERLQPCRRAWQNEGTVPPYPLPRRFPSTPALRLATLENEGDCPQTVPFPLRRSDAQANSSSLTAPARIQGRYHGRGITPHKQPRPGRLNPMNRGLESHPKQPEG
jgi:hypothetical protein